MLLIGGVALVLVICYALWFRPRAQKPKAGRHTEWPVYSSAPSQVKADDKIIIVKNASYESLSAVLSGFYELYQDEYDESLPQLVALADGEFLLVFPGGIRFDKFCCLVNYLHYPASITWSPSVTAWATIKAGDTWVSNDLLNQQVMLFVPNDDTEHDNVYLTTQYGEGRKLGFALGEENQLLASPKRKFKSLPLEVVEKLDKK